MKKAILIALSMAVLSGCSSMELTTYQVPETKFGVNYSLSGYQTVQPVKSVHIDGLFCFRDLPKRGWVELKNNPYEVELNSQFITLFEKDNRIAHCSLSVVHLYDKTELEKAKRNNDRFRQTSRDNAERKLNNALSAHNL